MSTYTGVTNFQKTVRILAHPVYVTVINMSRVEEIKLTALRDCSLVLVEEL